MYVILSNFFRSLEKLNATLSNRRYNVMNKSNLNNLFHYVIVKETLNRKMTKNSVCVAPLLPSQFQHFSMKFCTYNPK